MKRRIVIMMSLSFLIALSVAVTGCLAYYLTDNHDVIIKKSEMLVIDTDAGGDDAMAILLALAAWKSNDSDFEVVGITCVYGNTFEENVEINVLKTLTIANASEIPVYGGSQKPLISSNFTSEKYFGEDGFGDFVFEDTITARVDRSRHAALVLVELAKKHKGELNILALGPLTNIALALALDPHFLQNVKRLYVMGGSVAGMGNKSPGVEYNFGQDPESNFVTFNSMTFYNKSLLLFPWEACRSTKISREWRTNVLGTVPSTSMSFMNKVEKKILNEKFWTPADVMTAAVMIWPNLSVKTFSTRVTAITDGAARGGLLVDYSEAPEYSNTDIIQELDPQWFKRILLKYLSRN